MHPIVLILSMIIVFAVCCLSVGILSSVATNPIVMLLTMPIWFALEYFVFQNLAQYILVYRVYDDELQLCLFGIILLHRIAYHAIVEILVVGTREGIALYLKYPFS